MVVRRQELRAWARSGAQLAPSHHQPGKACMLTCKDGHERGFTKSRVMLSRSVALESHLAERIFREAGPRTFVDLEEVSSLEPALTGKLITNKQSLGEHFFGSLMTIATLFALQGTGLP